MSADTTGPQPTKRTAGRVSTPIRPPTGPARQLYYKKKRLCSHPWPAVNDTSKVAVIFRLQIENSPDPIYATVCSHCNQMWPTLRAAAGRELFTKHRNEFGETGRCRTDHPDFKPLQPPNTTDGPTMYNLALFITYTPMSGRGHRMEIAGRCVCIYCHKEFTSDTPSVAGDKATDHAMLQGACRDSRKK